MEYEYGLIFYKDVNVNMKNVITEDLHRSGMSEGEADDWLSAFIAMGGRNDAFIKVKRPVGQWQLDNASTK